ncbi:MAG: undecaprenyl-diphosphate phosphatase [Spirochaetia bacterium]|nr:undecaprenyl-diphosphate phosphatase [Spirochaetia bacterium]
MNIVESMYLGFLQGITEFLPVSSSGHLVISRDLLDIQGVPQIFDIYLHLATLLAIIIVFRGIIFRIIRSLWALARSSVEEEHRKDLHLTAVAVLSTAFTVVTALLLERIKPVDQEVLIRMVYALFLVTAALLIAAKFFHGKTPLQQISYKQGLIIGIAQGFGTLPGISRSGSTIAFSLISGIDRKAAGEYSFLISIPAVVGAFVYSSFRYSAETVEISQAAAILGSLTAFIVGYAALKLLLKLIQGGKLYLFSIYLIPLGIYGLVTH